MTKSDHEPNKQNRTNETVPEKIYEKIPLIIRDKTVADKRHKIVQTKPVERKNVTETKYEKVQFILRNETNSTDGTNEVDKLETLEDILGPLDDKVKLDIEVSEHPRLKLHKNIDKTHRHKVSNKDKTTTNRLPQNSQTSDLDTQETTKLNVTDSQESDFYESSDEQFESGEYPEESDGKDDFYEKFVPVLSDGDASEETIEHRVNFGSGVDDYPYGDYFPQRNEIEDAADYGLKKMRELVMVKEPELYQKGLWIKADSPAMKVAAFNQPSELALKLARYGYASLQASAKLAEQHGVLARNHPDIRNTFKDTALHTECPLRGMPKCRPASKRYRTADGTCNNPENPWRGSSMTPQQRFMPPAYHDGLSSIRRSVFGGVLPSARDISAFVHSDRNIEVHRISLILMQWGQFIDHDITASAQSRSFNGSVPRCCADGGVNFLPPHFLHPDCLPISVHPQDRFYGRFGIRCLEFVRSAPTSRIDCDLGWREQINQVTSYIDGSPIYGSSAQQSDSLRVFQGGFLQNHRLNPTNPPDPPFGNICQLGAITADCFRPGDGRVREQPGLVTLHIVWIRKHNQLAEFLEQANPHWSDEKIFQEARRIVAAMIQHITYREFLPLILGMEVIRLFELELVQKGYYTGYDPTVNPSAANSFSAAAYRFGHSLVQKSYVRTDTFHRILFNNVSLHEENLNFENIWSPGSVDRLLLGMCSQPSQRRDEFITGELTHNLFRSPGIPFGMDLAAINIQRGRDHGIAPYVAWRKPCGLSAIKTWKDLERIMTVETAAKFRLLYASIDDIDLYSAGLAEKPVRGGLVGPTFACIIAQQFSNLRKGDRFWYENGDFESSFTPNQLRQIRRISFAEVICDTMPEVLSLQPFVFMTPDNGFNRRESCDDFHKFDPSPWKEKESSARKKLRGHGKRPKLNVEHKEWKDINGKDVREVPLAGQEYNAEDMRLKHLIAKREEHIKSLKQKTLDTHSSSNKDEGANSGDFDKNETNKRAKRSMQIPFIEILSNFDSSTNQTDDISRTDNQDLGQKRSKRKRQNKRKNKPARKRNNTLVVNHNRNRVKVKRPSTEIPDEKTYYEQTYTIDQIPNAPTYQPPRPIQIVTGHKPEDDEISVIVPAKKPSDPTYLINTVTKRPNLIPTTKPDYNIHIQINYYLNSTDKPKPAEDEIIEDLNYSDNPNNPYSPQYDFVEDGYGQSSTKRPFSTTRRPYSTTTKKLMRRPTTKRPYYSSTTYYSTTKRPTTKTYLMTSRRPIYSTTERPYQTTKRPYILTNSHPLSIIYPTQTSTKRPNVVIIDEDDDYSRPSYYNQVNDFYKPAYDYSGTYAKRPLVGQVIKLDHRPAGQDDEPYTNGHTYEVPHKIYVVNKVYKHNNPPSVSDKLDFSPFLTDYPDRNYVQIPTNQRPYNQNMGKKFVKISSVRGHTTSNKHFDQPVFVAVQHKEGEDDMELTYSDIFEFFTNPNGTFVGETSTEHSKQNSETLNQTEEPVAEAPTVTQENESLQVELPKPMELLPDDYDFLV